MNSTGSFGLVQTYSVDLYIFIKHEGYPGNPAETSQGLVQISLDLPNKMKNQVLTTTTKKAQVTYNLEEFESWEVAVPWEILYTFVRCA